MSTSASVHEPVSAPVLPDGELEVFALRAAEQDVLVVVGEADASTAASLHDQLVRALPVPARPVVVELGALRFCDVSGLDALREVERSAAAAGVPLTFRGQSAQLQWLQRVVPVRPARGSRPAPHAVDVPDDQAASRAASTSPSAPRSPAPPDPGLPALTPVREMSRTTPAGRPGRG